MTREEVYRKCYKTLGVREDGTKILKSILPKEAIDAIIDCAVEEAVKALKWRSRNEQGIRTGS